MIDTEFDDPWRTDARERARKMFTNQGLQPVAQLMASAHRYAIDYIDQAPVIVLAATRGYTPQKRNERSHLTGRIAEFCRRGDRLKDVMKAYDLSLPLRQIKAGALSPTLWPVVFRLSRLSPSTLAQIIPESGPAQMHWLRALDNWLDHMSVRCQSEPGLFFDWAASAFKDLPYADRRVAPDLADFACANRDKFNLKWSRENAMEAQEEWHRSLAKRSSAAEAMAKAGIAFDTIIDYGYLPAALSLNELTFTALQTGEDLFLEGAAMRHCVATYISNVIRGTSRIYSIKSSGKRVATLELRPSVVEKIPRYVMTVAGHTMPAYELDRSRYVISQIKGPCNATPAKRIRDAADIFVKGLNGGNSHG